MTNISTALRKDFEFWLAKKQIGLRFVDQWESSFSSLIHIFDAFFFHLFSERFSSRFSIVYQTRMKFFDSFQTNLNKTVNLNQNFYRENYPRIWSVCEEGGRQAWTDICPIQPYHVSWWRGRLAENAFLGAGRGKTRHRKAGLRKIAPNPNQVLMAKKKLSYYTSSFKFGNGKCNEIFEIPDF